MIRANDRFSPARAFRLFIYFPLTPLSAKMSALAVRKKLVFRRIAEDA
jgi:hypothetical protein